MANITSSIEDNTIENESYYDFKIVIMVLSPIIMGIAHTLSTKFFYFLVLCVFKILTTHEGGKMDNLVSEGYCETRQITHSLLPGKGMNFVWIRGPVIAVRNVNSFGGNSRRGPPDECGPLHYTIYCLRFTHSADEIQKILMGRTDEINILWIESGNAHYFSTNSTKSIAPNPLKWQKSLSQSVCNNYEKNNRASILICGKPGLGKTSSCASIALILKEKLKVDPIIVRGILLTQSGFTLGELKSPTAKNPVVLVIDEIDATIIHAEEQKEKGEEFRSVAKDPSSLLGFLDRVNETNHYILLMTSNLDADKFVDKESVYYRYARKGRIDDVYDVSGDPNNIKNVSLTKIR